EVHHQKIRLRLGEGLERIGGDDRVQLLAGTYENVGLELKPIENDALQLGFECCAFLLGVEHEVAAGDQRAHALEACSFARRAQLAHHHLAAAEIDPAQQRDLAHHTDFANASRSAGSFRASVSAS